MTTPKDIEANDKPKLTDGYYWVYLLNNDKTRQDIVPNAAFYSARFNEFAIVGYDVRLQPENVEVLKPIKPYTEN